MGDKEQQKAVRLDKWLWAARFYKTRSLARKMIEGGKVDYNGSRAKPSRLVEEGALVRLLQGNVRKEVTILKLSEIRGPAKEAQNLYRETEESIKKREEASGLNKTASGFLIRAEGKPNKKERRALLSLKEKLARDFM